MSQYDFAFVKMLKGSVGSPTNQYGLLFQHVGKRYRLISHRNEVQQSLIPYLSTNSLF